MTILQSFIIDNCLTIHHKFNNRATKLDWWITRNYMGIYNSILEATYFLPSDSTLTRRAYHIINELYHIESCIHCQVSDKKFINYTSGYSEYCSRKCALVSQKRITAIKNTNIKKYGSTCSAQGIEILEKIKTSNMLKYGVEYSTQTSNMKDKSKLTKKLIYGDANYNNSDRRKETCLSKYGVEYSAQNLDTILKMQESKNKIYNKLLRDKEWLIEQNLTKNIPQIANDLNVSVSSVFIWMNKHQIDFLTHAPKEYKSQREIADFIVSLGISNIIYDDRRQISPKHIDIFLPEYNIGIEHNGIWHHREDKTRHLDKLNLCNNNGIRLLQFWDYQWIQKQVICKSIIKSHLGINTRIYARKCTIVPLSYKEFSEFMMENHIHGTSKASIRYGLTYDDTLVSVIGFSKSRYNKNYDYELVRYANKLDTNIIGGFSKLLKHSKLHNVISYCDLMLFSGGMYSSTGFVQLTNSKPGFSYAKGNIIKSRESMQNHKLQKVLKTYDHDISASENIRANKWFKFWNCGNGVWSYD